MWLPDSPHDPANKFNGSFKDPKYNTIFTSDTIDAIAKGEWSATKDDTTGWAAGYRRYGASKLCGVTMM